MCLYLDMIEALLVAHVLIGEKIRYWDVHVTDKLHYDWTRPKTSYPIELTLCHVTSYTKDPKRVGRPTLSFTCFFAVTTLHQRRLLVYVSEAKMAGKIEIMLVVLCSDKQLKISQMESLFYFNGLIRIYILLIWVWLQDL